MFVFLSSSKYNRGEFKKKNVFKKPRNFKKITQTGNPFWLFNASFIIYIIY